MKIFTKELSIDVERYPLDRIAPLNNILFVDIETTGFSAKSSSLYEIGCIYFDDDKPQLIQFFAENVSEEKEILSSFLPYAQTKNINSF